MYTSLNSPWCCAEPQAFSLLTSEKVQFIYSAALPVCLNAMPCVHIFTPDYTWNLIGQIKFLIMIHIKD